MARNYSLASAFPTPGPPLLPPVATERAVFSANTLGSQLLLGVSLVEVEQTEQVYTGPASLALGVGDVCVCVLGADDD